MPTLWPRDSKGQVSRVTSCPWLLVAAKSQCCRRPIQAPATPASLTFPQSVDKHPNKKTLVSRATMPSPREVNMFSKEGVCMARIKLSVL